MANEPPEPPSAAVLAADLRVALLRTARRVRAERSDEDVTTGEFTVLALLDSRGAATPGELAGLERVRPPSMSRILARLADQGFVTRAASPEDGRRTVVTLTPQGRAALDATRSRRNAWLARRLDELDPADRALLARAADVLRRIADS